MRSTTRSWPRDPTRRSPSTARRWAVGYKAVHTASGDDAVRETVRQVAAWIKQGETSDGTEVSNIIVIADSRLHSRKASATSSTPARTVGCGIRFPTGSGSKRDTLGELRRARDALAALKKAARAPAMEWVPIHGLATQIPG
jgi:hypothetical protein